MSPREYDPSLIEVRLLSAACRAVAVQRPGIADACRDAAAEVKRLRELGFDSVDREENLKAEARALKHALANAKLSDVLVAELDAEIARLKAANETDTRNAYDEGRAAAESEIVAWLHGTTFAPTGQLAQRIGRGEHRKAARGEGTKP